MHDAEGLVLGQTVTEPCSGGLAGDVILTCQATGSLNRDEGECRATCSYKDSQLLAGDVQEQECSQGRVGSAVVLCTASGQLEVDSSGCSLAALQVLQQGMGNANSSATATALEGALRNNAGDALTLADFTSIGSVLSSMVNTLTAEKANNRSLDEVRGMASSMTQVATSLLTNPSTRTMKDNPAARAAQNDIAKQLESSAAALAEQLEVGKSVVSVSDAVQLVMQKVQRTNVSQAGLTVSNPGNQTSSQPSAVLNPKAFGNATAVSVAAMWYASTDMFGTSDNSSDPLRPNSPVLSLQLQSSEDVDLVASLKQHPVTLVFPSVPSNNVSQQRQAICSFWDEDSVRTL
jgi:hypothetical protein